MNLTSKSRYALKIVLDLALHGGDGHVHRRDIASRQGIPADYLDQIMIRLRKSALVESVRGRGGGYRLGRPADEISVWELFLAAEGSLDPVQCLQDESSCGFDVACISNDPWKQIQSTVKNSLDNLSISMLIDRQIPIHQLCPAGGVRECKGPSLKGREGSALQ